MKKNPNFGEEIVDADGTVILPERKVQKHDLALAIVGLALSCLNPFTAAAGLVIDLISLSKARKNACGERYRGKNRIARILSIVGIPLAVRIIVYMIFRLIAAVLTVAAFVFLAEVMRRDGFTSLEGAVRAAGYLGSALWSLL